MLFFKRVEKLYFAPGYFACLFRSPDVNFRTTGFPSVLVIALFPEHRETLGRESALRGIGRMSEFP